MSSLHPDWQWIDEINQTPMAVLIDRYGCERRGNRCWPCPACGEEKRSRRDRSMGPVTWGDGWKCWRCGESGGPLDFVAWHHIASAKPAPGDTEAWHTFAARVTGRRPRRRGDRTVIDLALGRNRHRSQAPDTLVANLPQPSPVDARADSCPDRPGGQVFTLVANLPQATRAPREPERLPRPLIREARAFWDACLPVDADPEVSAWLRSRGLLPWKVRRLNLARALPKGMDCPGWARFKGKAWSSSGHRLVIRAVGPAPGPAPGQRQWAGSLRARNIRPDVAPGEKSASAACGQGSATGLMYADDTARLILQGKNKGPLPPHLILVEGEPDWLTWASMEACHAPGQLWGVLGLWNGSWTPEIAACIPHSATLVTRVHRDKAGQLYADKIESSLGGRRWTTLYRLVGTGPDDNDAHRSPRGLGRDPLRDCVRRERRAG